MKAGQEDVRGRAFLKNRGLNWEGILGLTGEAQRGGARWQRRIVASRFGAMTLLAR